MPFASSRIAAVALAALSFIPSAACGQWSAATPSISVSGSAEVRVAPDEIHVTFGTEVRHASLDTATETNAAKVATILKFLKASGVEAADVQTDFLSVSPNYRSDQNQDQTQVRYYDVRRNLGVRVRKAADFEKIVAGALKSGATHVHNIEFRTTELRKHRDAARQLAIRAAKEKAESLAKELGVEVGKVQSINESSGGGYRGGWGGYNSLQTQNVLQNSGGGGEDGEGALAVGQISVTASIHVTFALK